MVRPQLSPAPSQPPSAYRGSRAGSRQSEPDRPAWPHHWGYAPCTSPCGAPLCYRADDASDCRPSPPPSSASYRWSRGRPDVCVVVSFRGSLSQRGQFTLAQYSLHSGNLVLDDDHAIVVSQLARGPLESQVEQFLIRHIQLVLNFCGIECSKFTGSHTTPPPPPPSNHAGQ